MRTRERMKRQKLLLVLLSALVLLVFSCGDSPPASVVNLDTADGESADGVIDVVPDTGVEEDTFADTEEPDGVVDPCGCDEGEVCVTNGTVSEACFPADCPDEACADGEVCVAGECTAEMCAGVYCGEYPNACVEGECVIVSCEDAGVSCPDGLTCVSGECLELCSTFEDCAPQACVAGFCRACETGAQCGDGFECVSGECLPSCLDVCDFREYCDPELGVCMTSCVSDADCDGDEICDAGLGTCGPPECTQPGVQDVCDAEEICVSGRCSARNPPFLGNLCSGAQNMTSAQYSAVGILSPVEITGVTMESSLYTVQTGTVTVLMAQ